MGTPGCPYLWGVYIFMTPERDHAGTMYSCMGEAHAIVGYLVTHCVFMQVTVNAKKKKNIFF